MKFKKIVGPTFRCPSKDDGEHWLYIEELGLSRYRHCRINGDRTEILDPVGDYDWPDNPEYILGCYDCGYRETVERVLL